MGKKERFRRYLKRIESRDIEGKKIAVATVLSIVLILFISSNLQNSSKEKEEKKRVEFDIPVGDQAWEEPVRINITEERPSNISLKSTSSLVWYNKNEFNVTIETSVVERDFELSPQEKQMFKPSSDFRYAVIGNDRHIGTASVEVYE